MMLAARASRGFVDVVADSEPTEPVQQGDDALDDVAPPAEA
jgi:hypothetical protein